MWNWAIYGALIVGLLAGSGAIALLVLRVLDAWRALKRLRRGIARELDRLAELGEATADKVGTATDMTKVEESLSRLRVGLAQFAVLRGALDEAQDTFKRLAWIYPSK